MTRQQQQPTKEKDNNVQPAHHRRKTPETKAVDYEQDTASASTNKVETSRRDRKPADSDRAEPQRQLQKRTGYRQDEQISRPHWNTGSFQRRASENCCTTTNHTLVCLHDSSKIGHIEIPDESSQEPTKFLHGGRFSGNTAQPSNLNGIHNKRASL